jgi:hypothetical protein
MYPRSPILLSWQGGGLTAARRAPDDRRNRRANVQGGGGRAGRVPDDVERCSGRGTSRDWRSRGWASHGGRWRAKTLWRE